MKYHTLIEFDKITSTSPHILGRNVKVWTIKQDEVIRINLVKMSGELSLHLHPDADHSLIVLDGAVKVQIGNEFQIITKGDFISIPINVPHKYWSLTPDAWLVSMDAPFYDPKKSVALD